MIDSPALFRWGVGFLIFGTIIDFFRFGSIQLRPNDWLSIATLSSGITIISLATLDMVLDNKIKIHLFSTDYEDMYLENEPSEAIVDEMIGLGMDT